MLEIGGGRRRSRRGTANNHITRRHIVNHKTISVTPVGGPGTFDLVAAKHKVRTILADDPKATVEVILLEGTYFLDEPLRFESADGGIAGADETPRVRYRGDDGKRVMLFAGREIQGWSKGPAPDAAEGVYVSELPSGWKFNSLSENGARCHAARFPDSGYVRTAGVGSDGSRKSFKFHPGEIPRLTSPENARVFLWPGGPQGHQNWSSTTIGIEKIDYEAREIVLSRETGSEIGPGSRYFIENDPALLSAPGEFFLNPTTSLLSYMPYNVPVSEQTIVAPTALRAVEFVGTRENPVRGISIEGIEISTTDTTTEIFGRSSEHGAVHLENAEHIRIDGCRIHHTGYHGVLITGASKYNIIRNNLIYDVGHTGVQINGPRDIRAYVSSDNLVSNNHIHHAGNTVGHGSGIQISQSGNNRVEHNLVHDTPRYSISIKGPRPGTIIGTKIEGDEVTPENAHEFIHSRNNTIRYNDMSRANLDSQDTGVFETWGPGSANVLDNNRLHHSDIHFSFGFGIYLDDAANRMTITNNIVDHLQEGGEGTLWYPVFSKGVDNRFENNIVALNHASACFGSQEMAGEECRRLSIRRNVFYENGEGMHEFKAHSEDRYAVCDENLYFESKGIYKIGGHPSVDSYEAWRSMQYRRFDSRSLVTDPCFVDARRGDFRFRPDSPVKRLDICDIDSYSIGLTTEFPFPSETADPAFLFVLLPESGAVHQMRIGERFEADVRGRTASAYPVKIVRSELTFSSADVVIAGCDEDSVVTAESKGLCEITIGYATAGDTIRVSFWVEVI